MPVHLRAAIAVALMVAFGRAQAGDADTGPAPQAVDAQAATAPDTGPGLETAAPDSVPAGSLVRLEIVDPLSSATAKRGDRLRLRLAEPILAGQAVLLPAGTPG